MHLSKILQLMFSPEDDLGGGTATGELSVNDMIEEMGKDDDTPPGDDDILAETKEEKEPDDKEEKPIEIDEEKPEVDDLDAAEDVPRQAILKEYPDLFKKFPQLEKAYYREKAYAEVFPTIQDAKEAVEKVENYDKFEGAVLSGDLTDVLGAVKTADKAAFNTLVDNYLPMLEKADQIAYYHVISGVIKSTIVSMVKAADEQQNEDLKAAGVILNQFIFGKQNFEKHGQFGPHKETEPDDLTKEKQQFHQEKFTAALDSLATAATNTLTSTVSKYIDPKGSMTDYVKRVAIRDAVAEVEEKISGDKRFKATLDKLWEVAAKNNYGQKYLNDIKKAHNNKAATLLPEIIKRHRNAALKGLGKRVNEEREEPVRKGPISTGRAAAASNSGKKEMTVPKGMSSRDFLMQDD